MEQALDIDNDNEAFVISDLWKSSVLFSRPQHDLVTPINPDLYPSLATTGSEEGWALPKDLLELSLRLPKPDDFQFRLPEDTDPSSLSILSSETGRETPSLEEPEGEDVWQSSDILKEETAFKLYTWESFLHPKSKEPRNPYITEAECEAFDALVHSRIVEGQESDVVLRPDSFLHCLLQMGLGRSSVLFQYDENRRTFTLTLENGRMSGLSPETSQSLVAQFIRSGNQVRRLKAFVDRIQGAPKPLPALTALADCTLSVLSALWESLAAPKQPVRSPLQLQELFYKPGHILDCFVEIISSIGRCRTEAQVCSVVYEKVQHLESNSHWLRGMLLEILVRVSRPWLESAETWTGLKMDVVTMSSHGSMDDFLTKSADAQSGSDLEPDETIESAIDQSRLPTFINEAEGRTLFETGRSLRLLRDHDSQHPLVDKSGLSSEAEGHLEWKFSWDDVERVQSKSKAYQKSLLDAINRYKVTGHAETAKAGSPTAGGFEFDTFGKNDEKIGAYIAESSMEFNDPLTDAKKSVTDKLHSLISDYTDACGELSPEDPDTFAPPLALASYLSFGPMFGMQAKLVNSACLRLLLKKRELRTHLSLLRRYHLFGDGVFTSRLAHALFDPEMDTAERKRGVALGGAVMGLRLGSRENWPPASSELRLALMGVLTESYARPGGNGSSDGTGYLARGTDLPGGLSFAIRSMSEEEVQKCLDPNSIQALDFLRLEYKPPPPLDAVITGLSLLKYDLIFRLLLRVVRMLFVVSQLFRDATDRTSFWQGIDTTAQRFRIEAHNFVATVSAYFLDVAVSSTWDKFEKKLAQIERRIELETVDGLMGDNEGIDRLRQYHERVLDRIMFALFLRKRQVQVMALLEDIFSAILSFARYSRDRTLGLTRRPQDDIEVRQIYNKFRKRVGVFVTVCRGLSEKRGYGEKKGINNAVSDGLFGDEDMSEEGGNTVGQLLLKLEMSGYYAGARSP